MLKLDGTSKAQFTRKSEPDGRLARVWEREAPSELPYLLGAI